jgi:hypothetical protein
MAYSLSDPLQITLLLLPAENAWEGQQVKLARRAKPPLHKPRLSGFNGTGTW